MAAWQPQDVGRREVIPTLLNRMDADLARRLHELRLGIERDASQRLEMNMDALLNRVGATIERSPTDGLNYVERGMLRNVAFDIACLRWPVPRLACLLPAHEGNLSDSERSYLSWSARLPKWCHRGRKVDKGIFSRKLRLFFLCAHDMSLAECGRGGQGYEVKELLAWVKKAKPAAKVGVALGSIVIKACTGWVVPTDYIDSAFGDTFGGVVSEMVKEGAFAIVDEMKSTWEDLSNDDNEERLARLQATRKVQICWKRA